MYICIYILCVCVCFASINFKLQLHILIFNHRHLRRLTTTNQFTTNCLLIFTILYNLHCNNCCELVESHRPSEYTCMYNVTQLIPVPKRS